MRSEFGWDRMEQEIPSPLVYTLDGSMDGPTDGKRNHKVSSERKKEGKRGILNRKIHFHT